MRKWLAIVLLVLMPLQLSWAAVAAYCQHEVSSGPKHFGHHEHQHQAADGKDSTSKPAQPNFVDADCAVCHAGCATALTAQAVLPVAPGQVPDTADYQAHLAPPPLERLDRPQWSLLA